MNIASQDGIRLSGPIVEAEVELGHASTMEDALLSDKPLSEDELLDHSNSVATRLGLVSGQDLIEAYPWRLRGTASRGWGLFAGKSIPVGESIMTERPTIVYDHYSAAMANFGKNCSRARSEEEWDRIEAELLQKKVEKLSTQQQKEIMLLHNCHEGSGVSSLLGIIRTNVFGLSDTQRGVYILCSRFNHDCEPNCTYEFSDMKSHTIRIISIKYIKVGDELTITYVPHAMKLEERQKTLARKFGFECKCSRCVLEGDRLYTFSYGEQQRARLCFRPRRLQSRTENDRAGDFLTTIVSISSAGDLKSIQKDEIILQERPLMILTKDELAAKAPVIYQRLLELPRSMCNQYLGLYNWRSKTPNPGSPAVVFLHKGGLINDKFKNSEYQGPTSREELLGIWETNNFTLEYGKEAVFPIASHLDHSCQPSCRVIWRPFKKTLDLVANRPHKAGDVITICYDYWKIYTLPFEARQKFLKKNYGFDCFCIRCYPHLKAKRALLVADVRACVENINHMPLPEVFPSQLTINDESSETSSGQGPRAGETGYLQEVLGQVSRQARKSLCRPQLAHQTARKLSNQPLRIT